MRETSKIVNKDFHDAVYIRIVADVKRVLEKWTLDAGFQDAYRRDPERALAETGLVTDPKAVKLLLDPDEEDVDLVTAVSEGRLGREVLPESYLLYKAFIREKLDSREMLRKELCVPDEPHFRLWRAQQERRCVLEFGDSARSMIHAPLMFELSEGCSVGCPFCGVAAGGLKGVFRYTKENAALWRDILRRMHALIGDAAGRGAIYYSCEGLDNPDYEEFLKDYFAEFGVVPQTTTAIATRDIERTRALLQYGIENDPHIDRFSVRSPAMRDEIFQTFSPEELLLVELLPQFPEAPFSNFAVAGRNRTEEQADEVSGTIACISGFVVNMQDKTVRLMTPFVSDRTHPTGEWILDKRSFSTAEDLEETARAMILQYMPERLKLSDRCGASCDFRLEDKDGQVWIHGFSVSAALMDAVIQQEILDQLSTMLKARKHTGYDILNALPESTDYALVILLLNTLWDHGLIDQIVND